MEMLQQVFITIIAAFLLFILIAKTVSPVTNGEEDDHRRWKSHGFSKLATEDVKLKTEKSSSNRNGMKKVRFAVDHDELVVNKVVAGPSETKQVVFEENHDESLVTLNVGGSAVKSPEEEFGGVEKADYVADNKADDREEGKSELVDPIPIEGPLIHERNVGNVELNRICMKLLCDDGIDEDEKEKEGLISDEEDSEDDEWEGIERSDLEKVFAMAADYGKVDDHLQSLGSDLQMQLYALHKVATEGPCHEPQPMALKLSARAKWNAWQKLGNMDPDVAMEQYITLLSQKLPQWSQGICSLGVDLSSSVISSTVETSQNERKSEIESGLDVGDLVGDSVSMNEDKH